VRLFACAVIVMLGLGIRNVIAPLTSEESQRLQRLGTQVEERYSAMSEKEQRQLEKLMGWKRPSEPRAQ
jgi:hypothetical protein